MLAEGSGLADGVECAAYDVAVVSVVAGELEAVGLGFDGCAEDSTALPVPLLPQKVSVLKSFSISPVGSGSQCHETSGTHVCSSAMTVMCTARRFLSLIPWLGPPASRG